MDHTAEAEYPSFARLQARTRKHQQPPNLVPSQIIATTLRPLLKLPQLIRQQKLLSLRLLLLLVQPPQLHLHPVSHILQYPHLALHFVQVVIQLLLSSLMLVSQVTEARVSLKKRQHSFGFES